MRASSSPWAALLPILVALACTAPEHPAPDAGPAAGVCGVAARVGERRVLGIVLDVGEARNRCDEAALRGVLFSGPTSLNAFYAAQSYGRLAFTGDVARVSLPATPGECDEAHLVQLAEAAEREVRARGYDLAAYTTINYSLPALVGPRCGLAVTMAAAQPRVFNREPARCDWPNVYWHENAHALVVPGTETGGLGHAALLLADGQVMFNGDHSSVTGNTGVGAPFSGPERAYAGWLTDTEIRNVRASEEVTLVDLAEAAGGIRLARLALPGDHPDAEALYLAYRRARDGFESARPLEYDGLNVHRFTPCPSDFGTGRGGGQVHAVLVGVLRADGDTLAHAGARITLRRSDASGATVGVEFPGQ